MIATVYIPLWTVVPMVLVLFWLLSTVWEALGGVRAGISDWWWEHYTYPKHFGEKHKEWDD